MTALTAGQLIDQLSKVPADTPVSSTCESDVVQHDVTGSYRGTKTVIIHVDTSDHLDDLVEIVVGDLIDEANLDALEDAATEGWALEGRPHA